MAEKSQFWYTDGFTGATGDGAAPYTQEEFRAYNAALLGEGVVAGAENELAISGSATPLSVATGRAQVAGFHYWNDAAKNLTVTTPSVGTTGGRVVLRVDWTAATIRLFALLNTDGNAGIPALTQTLGVTYEISLASFTVTTGGVITLTDTRQFALFQGAGMIKLRETAGNGTFSTVSWTGIQQNLRHLRVVVRARGTSVLAGVNMRFNGDSGANYDYARQVTTQAATTPAATFTAGGTSLLAIAPIVATSELANMSGDAIIEIPDYRQTSFYKTVIAKGMKKGDATTGWQIIDYRGWWLSTAAINRIDLISSGGNFQTGSLLALYGIL